MNTTNTLDSTGRVNAGAYTITFVATADYCWIMLYNANTDSHTDREYATVKETLETVTLLITSQTMREEFSK